MFGNLMNSDNLMRSFLAVAVLAASLAGRPAYSAPADTVPPSIGDVVVIQKKGRLVAFMSLKDAFTPELFEVIRSGVTTRFTFEIALMRNRTLLYDPVVKKQTLVHQVKYDTLKKVYTFRAQNGTDERTQKVTKNRGEMMDWMSEINGHSVIQVRDLEPGDGYYLQVRAKLNSVNFPFPFNYMLSFLDRNTPWISSRSFSAGGM